MEQIDNFQQDKAYRRAKKRVKDLKEFYKHFLLYFLVNAIFIGRRIYKDIDQGDPWVEAFTDRVNYDLFFWWGIRLIIHAATVFIAPNILSKEWEERKIKEQMEKNEVG